MKNTFSQSMAWLHTWGGLLFGWILFAIFLTGSLSVFDREITHWMQPEITNHEVSVAEALNIGGDYLQANVADSPSWFLLPPTIRNPGMAVFWQEGEEFEHVTLDPVSGEVLLRDTEGGHFFVHFHFELNSGVIGRWVVGLVAMMMLVGLLTGIVIHKRIFKDFFTFRPKSGAQRSWLDAHNALGVLTLPFLLVITFSGLAIFAFMYIPSPIKLLYGSSLEDQDEFFHEAHPHVHLEPSGESAPLLLLGGFAERARKAFGGNQIWFLSIDHPGDKNAVVTAGGLNEDRLTLSSQRILFNGVSGEVLQNGITMQPAAQTQRVLSGLHFAQFGGYITHWLYFLSGLIGAAMIATGLILFTVKRRRQYAGANEVSPGFLKFAEKMNVAAVAGPILASLAYFWSNRLLPLDLAHHASWEIGAFFGVWLGSLTHALLRSAHKAWFEQFAAAALLCLTLPLLNLLTTDQHLLATIPAGHWNLAGVDLTVTVMGILFACLVKKLAGRHTKPVANKQAAPLWEFADT